MTKNLKIFILVSTILNAIFQITVTNWYLRNIDKHPWVIPVCMLIALVYLVIVADIVHRLTGIPTKKTKKLIEKATPYDLTRKQFATMNRYWSVWFITFLGTGIADVVLLQRQHWQSGFGVLLAVVIIRSLDIIYGRKTIRGHSKKELFQ